MAGRNEKIQIDIEATDDASPKIEKLAKKIDGLESDEARIVVSADITKLESQLDRAQSKLVGLEGDEATVQARLVGTLEEDLEQASKLLQKLDGQTGTVKIDSQGAKQGIDDLGKSADSSGSVLANMVGNATQDIGALGGVAGSAGVAIGQMGEYMADARASGEGFGSIIKNFAGVAAPIAGIALATKVISDQMGKIAAAKAFRTDKVKAYADALKDAESAAEGIGNALEAAGGVQIQLLEGDLAQVFDITKQLTDAGIGVGEFSALVEGGKPKIDAWAAAMTAAGVDTGLVNTVVFAATQEHDAYAESADAAAASAKFFGDAQFSVKGQLDDLIPSVDELKDAQKTQADAAKNAADRAHDLAEGFADARRESELLKTENQKLRDEISNDQFLLDLRDTWRDVEVAGDEAWQAAADGALDAGIKADDYKTKQNAAKDELLAFKDELGTLPTNKLIPIMAEIDEGSFMAAEARMAVLMRNRTMELSIIAKGGDGFAIRLNGQR